MALAWLRGRRTSPVPILGARKASQLDDQLGCLELQLPETPIERLDQASSVSLGYPHEFLARIRATYAPERQPLGSKENR